MSIATKDGITLHITYHVSAYDESFAGYGDNASRDFDNESAAVAYAKKLRAGMTKTGPQYEPIRVIKKITMDPIYADIQF